MDASAYLKRHGWRGDGHSLDHTNRGIKKPLLVSQKVDVLGLGKDKHGPVSDQWWLRAFDQGLKNFGTGQQSVLASVQQHGINRGGLYGRFVQGERFEGSIGLSAESSGISSPNEGQDTPRDMVVDTPPRDGLDAAPENMEHPDRKRKRSERPVDKRARRKIEQGEKRAEAIEEDTLEPEKADKERPRRDVNGQAKQFVVEALRRGLIPTGPGDVHPGMVLTGVNPTAMHNEPLPHGLQEVFNQVGLHRPMVLPGESGSNALKEQKHAREKMKRELKRAAKAYLTGDTLQSREESKKHKKTRSVKGPKVAQKDVDRLAEKHERAAKKEERRQRKAAEKARRQVPPAEATSDDTVVLKDDAEYSRDDSTKSSNTVTANSKQPKHKFEDGADEIKSGRTKKGLKKMTLGLGYIVSSALERKTISPEKLQEYRRRAADKGMGLEEYIRRREQKTRLKSKLRS